jgi:hypothetical protein
VGGINKREFIVGTSAPKMTAATAKPFRLKLRDDYNVQYQHESIKDKVIDSLSHPLVRYEENQGTGVILNMISEIKEEGGANLIPLGTTECLNGTPYDPKGYVDADNFIEPGADVKAAFGAVALIPHGGGTTLVIKHVDRTYGHIDPANHETKEYFDEHHCFDDFESTHSL